LSAAEPFWAAIVRGVRGQTLRRREDAFLSLARAIIGQQISVKAAESVWRKMAAAVGEISPQAFARAGEATLRANGATRQKSGYLVSLAAHFLDGSFDLAAWPDLDDETVIAQLTVVKGIGRWTAEMFLIFHLLRPDVLPLGDIGVQRALRDRYNGGNDLTVDEMRALAEPWRPWRSVASWYLWRSLDAVPVDR
jgi:DNA-3-methyladenine glycosylase II